MRLYKVVILVNLALGVGALVGYHWWGQETERLRRELDVARRATRLSAAGEHTWSVRGIIRAVAPERKLVVITHEEIPGVMSPMTMAFPATDGTLLRGLTPGDRVEVTLRAQGGELVVVALRKETGP
jgi:Cu/Ag efflux protein CusF